MIVRKSDFFRFVEKVSKGRSEELRELLRNPLMLKIRKKTVVPRNLGQHRFLDLILKHDLVFGIGPAGTGKTFLAMIAALHSLLEGKVQRIVLARPAAEAGKRWAGLEILKKSYCLTYGPYMMQWTKCSGP